jgi:(p)ppGpp synthase/HD superfamily hydrolase
VSIEEVEAEFGTEVAMLVSWLTDVSRPEDGNRATRKNRDLEHTREAPAAAQTIKLADLIDNTRTIKAHDPAFWKVYRREKLALLRVLRKGDPNLWQRAAEGAHSPSDPPAP